MQPIVILGGFLSEGKIYGSMKNALAACSGQPVLIVDTHTTDWLPAVVARGWSLVLNKLDETVNEAVALSTDGKVTLVCHSAGGVLARLYLGANPFFGTVYDGKRYVDHLITLGSPHYNGKNVMYGGAMSRYVEDLYPGAHFSEEVQYISVAGRVVQGDRKGTGRQRQAFRVYNNIIGQGDVWGDGLIPVRSALLEGSRQIELDGVGHFVGFGGSWYGVPEVIARWWTLVKKDAGIGSSVLGIESV